MQLEHLHDQLAGVEPSQCVPDLGVGGEVRDGDDAVLRHAEVVLAERLQHVHDELAWGGVWCVVCEEGWFGAEWGKIGCVYERKKATNVPTYVVKTFTLAIK